MSENLGTKTPVDQEPLSIITPIPLAQRKRDSRIYLVLAAGVCIVIWALQYRSDWVAHYWWYVWPIALLGLFDERAKLRNPARAH